MRVSRHKSGRVWFFGGPGSWERANAYGKFLKRRPFNAVRSKCATLAVTPADWEFIDGAARRLGKPINRMLGDAIEAAIRRGILEELAGEASV